MFRTRILRKVIALPVLLLLLNVSPLRAQWTFPVIPGTQPNAATSLGGDCFRITPQTNNTRGVVWNNVQLDLNQPFDISFSVNLGPASGGFGADGIALVLQRQGLTAAGAGGNGLGFSGAVPLDPFYGPITPSIAFELDSWGNNGAGVADPVAGTHHVAIHQNGVITSAVAGPTPALPSGNVVNDSSCRTYRVIWTPGTNNVQVFYPTLTTLRINANIDLINTVFSGNSNVWWGFTGSSGSPGQSQVICVDADFANAGPDTSICPGQVLQLQASGGLIYFWNQGFPIISDQNIANPTFSSIIPLPYNLSVLVTNIPGCNDNDDIVVTVEPNPNATPGNGGSICLGDSIQLGGNPNPDYSYQWTPATYLNGTTTSNPWATPTMAGSFDYQLLVVDTSGLAGCRDSATVTVVATDTPSVALSATLDTVCNGGSTTVTAAATGGTGTYSYLWSPGGMTTASINVSPASSTTYFVTVTDQSSCSTVGSLGITVLDTPAVTVSASLDTICAGQSTDLTAQASGGLPPYTYDWGGALTGSTVTVSPQTTTTFVVTVTDGNGCQGTAPQTIIVNVADSIDILVGDTFICNNGVIAIQNTFGTPGVDTWTWSPAIGVSNPSIPNPVLSPPVDTTYYLFGFNSISGCGYTDTIHIDVFELNLSHWLDSTICLGDSINLDLQIGGGSGNYLIQWLQSPLGYISDDSIANPVIAPAVNTLYTALVTDTTNGCVSTVTVSVEVSQLQVQASPGSITINPGQSVQMQASGAMFYSWAPDTSINCITCPDPVSAPAMSILYTVTGTDTNGCRGTALVNIMVDSLVVPNVFSPNGDGVNDELFFNYYGNAFYQISVYDRWGVRIFSTTDKNAMWNGKTAGGADAPESVYYVMVRIVGDEAIPEKDKQRVFAVTLLR